MADEIFGHAAEIEGREQLKPVVADNRALPLLAVADGQIIADGTLHHLRAGSRRHIGEVRVVVDPGFRNRGVGRELLRHLIEIPDAGRLGKIFSKRWRIPRPQPT